MPKIFTEQEIDEFLATKGLRRLEPYKNGYTKIKLECVSNGRQFFSKINKIKDSKTTDYSDSYRSGKPKLTLEDINNRIKDKNLTIEFIGNRKGSKGDFRCINPSCPVQGGRIWTGDISRISLGNRGCPSCCLDENDMVIKNDKYTHEQIVKMIKDRPIELISDYKGMGIRADWQCNDCGHIFHTKVRDIIHSETNCPECNIGNSLSREDIVERMKNRTDVYLAGDYKGSDTNTEWKCYAEDHTFSATPNSVANKGTGCPCCINKSETEVGKLIVEHIPALSDLQPQKFYSDINPITHKAWVDFYFKIGDKEFIVEYQGEDHYMAIDRGQGKARAEANMSDRNIRDNQKREYCKAHNIFLLEVPYWFSDSQIIEQLKMINDVNWDKIPYFTVPDVLPDRVRKYKTPRRKKKSLEGIG